MVKEFDKGRFWESFDCQLSGCPVCSSNKRQSIFSRADGASVAQCDHCNCLYLIMRPIESEVNRFYDNYQGSNFDAVSRSHSEKWLEDIKINYDIRLLEIAKRLRISDLRILDLGCGTGEFVHSLNVLGASAIGLDLDSKSIEKAVRFYGDKFRVGGIDEIHQLGKFDLIALNDVIEHLHDPVLFIEKCRNALNDNGIILIWTPNWVGIDGSLNLEAMNFDFEHIQYFDPVSINFLARKVGLIVEHLEICGVRGADAKQIDEYRRPSFMRVNFNAVKKYIYHSLVPVSLKKRRAEGILRGAEHVNRMGNYHLFCILRRG